MSNQSQKSVIFISGRFRSGTSMLWNIFDKLPNYCAWYEPLHPNLLSHIQHVKPKQDHIGIDEYWQNYQKLNDLENHYNKSFGQNNILLEKHQKWPELKDYIQYLIDESGDKTPVLQFNRTDLKLSWLKNNFPQATIVSIQRKPLPLWASTRKHLDSLADKNNESHPDAYDLLQWSADLSKHFPMLLPEANRHSYYRHYFIWKLTEQMALSHADINLSLENDFHQSLKGVGKLKTLCHWNKEEITIVQKLIQQPDSVNEKQNKKSSIQAIEKHIDELFNTLGLNKLYPSSPIDAIKLEYRQIWDKYPFNSTAQIQELLTALSQQKDELTELNNNS